LFPLPQTLQGVLNMGKTRNILKVSMAVVTLLALAACGPIFGQLMRVSEGIKQFEVSSGRLSDLKGGGTLLVYAPFVKAEEAFIVCPGEIEEQFAGALSKAEVFKAESFLERDPVKAAAARAGIKGKTPEQLRQELNLTVAPERILFGTMVRREMTVAPMRGVVMEEAYRLEFHDLRSGAVTVLEVAVRDLAEDCIPALVKELVARLANG
jgi:hypothetical protein